MDLQEFFSMLVCPKCRSDLTLMGDENSPEGLFCATCHTVYPVQEGIPILLTQAAVPLDDWNNGTRTTPSCAS